jgi:hypothetical protein
MSNNENAPEVTAPERIEVDMWGGTGYMQEWEVGLPQGVDAEVTAEYVLASKADAQAEELRAEVERLRALLDDCRTSVEFHADNIDGMETPTWMERRRRADALRALMGRIDKALGKPADAEQEGDDA